MTIELSLGELAAVVLAAVALATTDAAALSRLAIAFLAKKLGVSPQDVRMYEDATEGQGQGNAEEAAEDVGT